MKITIASATFLLAAVVAGYPANGNSNTGNSNSNGNSNSESNTNSNSGNNNGNSNSGSNSNSNNGNNNGGNGNNNNGNNNVSQMQAELMQTAISAWMRDTGVVSNFLNMGPTITDDATFRNQAQIAHSAEVDELTHKAVLDQYLGTNNRNANNANGTLSNGSFQLVVDRLDDMARQGMAQKNGIDDINNVRCVNVLPNIDMYMRESAVLIGNGQAVQQAVRPAACGNIVAGQGNAITAGAVPNGYQNGKLIKGNSNLNPNIAATPEDDDTPEINVAGEGSNNNGNNNNGNNNNNNNNNNPNNGNANTGNNNNGNANNGNNSNNANNNKAKPL